MTDANFTIGPLTVLKSTPSDGFDGYWIKAQPSPALRGFTRPVGMALEEPDARVFAAAGELYTALVTAAEHTCSLTCQSVGKTGVPFTHSPECKANRAALARATA